MDYHLGLTLGDEDTQALPWKKWGLADRNILRISFFKDEEEGFPSPSVEQNNRAVPRGKNQPPQRGHVGWQWD